MTMIRKVFLFTAFIVIHTTLGASIPATIAVDSETCTGLCWSCDGVAKFENGNCECSIDTTNGLECVSRMKRQANDYGLDVVSCDSSDENVEPRSTRCIMGSTRHLYGKSDIERVAKYFMQDGPLTGSIFIAPPYTDGDNKLEENPTVGQSADCEGLSKSTDIVGQPAEKKSPSVASPLMTQPEDLIPEKTTATKSPLITQPKELIPEKISATKSPLISQSKDLIPEKTAAPKSPLITQPKDLIPEKTAATKTPTPRIPAEPLNSLGLQEIAPQFLSMLGEVLTKPILGLPHAIKSVSEVPGVRDIVGAPANLLNSIADQMAEKSKTAKENLDNFRETVSKAKEDMKVGLANLKASKKASLPEPEPEPTVSSPMKNNDSPSYSIANPQPMLSWLNPQSVGSQAPMQLIGSPFIGSPSSMQLLPTQYLSAAHLLQPSEIVSSAADASPKMFGSLAAPGMADFNGMNLGQMVGSPVGLSQFLGSATPMQFMPAQFIQASPNQMLGASASSSSSDCTGQMVGSPSFGNQMVGASMVSGMPVIQTLGTIPLSSIVSHMYVGSPMAYYSTAPALQPVGNNLDEEKSSDAKPEKSLEEVPLSSTQKNNCNESSMKFTRDVKAVATDGKIEEVKEIITETTTTEIPLFYRTTTQKPKATKSTIARIKSVGKKIKAEKNVVKANL